MFIKRNR